MTSHILTPSKLRGINYKWYTTVPLFDGELDYLKGAHLWYAVPAFLCMIFILIPPPTILILEPILTKLFSMDCFTRTPPLLVVLQQTTAEADAISADLLCSRLAILGKIGMLLCWALFYLSFDFFTITFVQVLQHVLMLNFATVIFIPCLQRHKFELLLCYGPNL